MSCFESAHSCTIWIYFVKFKMVKVKIQFKNINNKQVIKTRVKYEIGDKPGFKVIKILIVMSGHLTKRKCRVTY